MGYNFYRFRNVKIAQLNTDGEKLDPSPIRRYGYMDALRGLAIMGVVLVHSGQNIQPDHVSFQLIADRGALGVQLFFIASALTLCLSMETRSGTENHPVRNFFIRRFFRIAPMFYLGVTVYFMLNGFASQYWAPNGIKWWFIPLTVGFAHGWSPETINSVVPGGWSIAVEFTFYLILPILFKRIKNIQSALGFVVGSILVGKILSILVANILTSHYAPEQQYLVQNFVDLWIFSQLPVFGVGILVFHLIHRYQAVKRQFLGVGFLILSLLLAAAFLRLPASPSTFTQQIAYGFVFGLLTLALHVSNLPMIDNPIIQWLGKLSFSIYILHFIVLRLIMIAFRGQFPISGSLGTVALFVSGLVASAIISFITYTFIEKPGIEIGKIIIRQLETQKGIFAANQR